MKRRSAGAALLPVFVGRRCCSQRCDRRLGQAQERGGLQGGMIYVARTTITAGRRRTRRPAVRAEDAREQGAEDLQGEHRGRPQLQQNRGASYSRATR